MGSDDGFLETEGEGSERSSDLPLARERGALEWDRKQITCEFGG